MGKTHHKTTLDSRNNCTVNIGTYINEKNYQELPTIIIIPISSNTTEVIAPKVSSNNLGPKKHSLKTFLTLNEALLKMTNTIVCQELKQQQEETHFSK